MPDLYRQAESIYNLGELLLHDDKMDIGYFTYYNRPHKYQGRLVKDHPSPYHHWPIGIALMFVGELLGTLATLNDMKTAAQEDNSNNQFLPKV